MRFEFKNFDKIETACNVYKIVMNEYLPYIVKGINSKGPGCI